jgi:hypothetical protein
VPTLSSISPTWSLPRVTKKKIIFGRRERFWQKGFNRDHDEKKVFGEAAALHWRLWALKQHALFLRKCVSQISSIIHNNSISQSTYLPVSNYYKSVVSGLLQPSCYFLCFCLVDHSVQWATTFKNRHLDQPTLWQYWNDQHVFLKMKSFKSWWKLFWRMKSMWKKSRQYHLGAYTFQNQSIIAEVMWNFTIAKTFFW